MGAERIPVRKITVEMGSVECAELIGLLSDCPCDSKECRQWINYPPIKNCVRRNTSEHSDIVVALILGLSRQRVNQLVNSAFPKIRRRLMFMCPVESKCRRIAPEPSGRRDELTPRYPNRENRL